MKLKLFTVALLGLAVATTLTLTGCRTEETTVTPETTEIETPAMPEATEEVAPEAGVEVETMETTEVPAAEGAAEAEHGAAEEAGAEHH